jgi:hypothetical protein
MKRIIFYSVFCLLLGSTVFANEMMGGPTTTIAPKPGDPTYRKFEWNYLETAPAGKDVSAFPACAPGFAVDDECAPLGSQCRVDRNLYDCRPEDGIVLYTGKVVDSKNNNKGIPGVYVQMGFGYPGFTDMIHTTSDADGNFVIKFQGCTLQFAYAHQPNFLAPDGYEYTSAQIKCELGNKWSAENIILSLHHK